MKTVRVLVLFFLIFSIEIVPQNFFPSYFIQNDLAFSSPGSFRYGLNGYENPATLALLDQPDLIFSWNDADGSFLQMNHWGLFASVPGFGFGMVKTKAGGLSVTDYKLSAGAGNKKFNFGIGYGWSTGSKDFFLRKDFIALGTLLRLNSYISLGLSGNLPFNSKGEGAVDLGLRPFGNEKITLFGDYVFKNQRFPSDVRWSAGAVVEPVDGIRIFGRYFDTKVFSAGLQLSFGNISLFSQSSFNDKSEYKFNTYGIRIGGYDRNIADFLSSHNEYLELNLRGGIKYQKNKLFDNSNSLHSLLQSIDAAANDKSVSGIVMNLSGISINREMLWELREKFREFKDHGKKIVIYIDRVSIDDYHLASVADKIVIDPLGSIQLPGFIRGKGYYKNLLELAGIGFRELRYFKYKSASETFANDKMSDADREQLQLIVDNYYETAKKEICLSRNLTYEKFDELVNDISMFNPEDAIKYGLADTIARFDALNEVIKNLEGRDYKRISAGSLEKLKLPGDNFWGRKKEIALIYAIGSCAMDEGINARSLVNYIQAAVENENIKAIILRVDSPGGDALASDLIAEALRKAKGKKQVIISQGYVAGSGGYWLSMYGDTIVSAPTTITGSIGVIGGYYFNKSLKEKIGLTTDFVKRGEHADYGFGFTFPLINMVLPDRDMNDFELMRAENIIKSMYKDFVTKVALGRNKTFDEIEKIAQGRVWSGINAKELGLVDVLGGLDIAIKIALEKTGLKENEYEIVEYPDAPWIDLSMFIPKIVGVETIRNIEQDPFINELRFRLQNNGTPMPILPLEQMEMIYPQE
ncbi:MAG: S49 family peptidase [Ignavibacteriaceae bacterium]|nr:S49 family peptidase [Ignavibacteriaceae bacterium]